MKVSRFGAMHRCTRVIIIEGGDNCLGRFTRSVVAIVSVTPVRSPASPGEGLRGARRIRMRQSIKGVVCLFSALLPLTLLGCGSATDGAEAPEVAENVGESQQALANSAWSVVSSVSFPDQAITPTVAAKRSNASSVKSWIIAWDSDTPKLLRLSERFGTNTALGAWSAWSVIPGTAGDVQSPPASVSWQGTDAFDWRNVAVAYINGSGQVKVGLSPKGNASGFNAAWSTLSLAGGFATNRPAIAWLQSRLFVFAVSNAGVIHYNYAPISNNSGLGAWAGWTSLGTILAGQTVSGGVAAAASNSTSITILGIPTGCASCTGRTRTLNASSLTLTAWTSFPGGAVLEGGSSPTLTTAGLFIGNFPARFTGKLASGGTVVSALSPGFAFAPPAGALNMAGCFGAADTNWSLLTNDNQSVFTTMCGSVNAQFSSF
jgi:hypothetical protein